MGEPAELELVAEQLRHTLDLIRAEIVAIRTELAHFQELTDHRLGEIERRQQDHEVRIRELRDSAQQSKTTLSLMTGGNSALAVLAILLGINGG
jgi:hypothetical protein